MKYALALALVASACSSVPPMQPTTLSAAGASRQNLCISGSPVPCQDAFAIPVDGPRGTLPDWLTEEEAYGILQGRAVDTLRRQLTKEEVGVLIARFPDHAGALVSRDVLNAMLDAIDAYALSLGWCIPDRATGVYVCYDPPTLSGAGP